MSTEQSLKKKIPLVEAFGPTIQGEGSVIGYQTMFLRFGGCDYRCERCDSLHAVLPEMFSKSAPRLTQQEILDQALADAGHCEWITFSGGNPAMHELGYLVEGLHKAGKRIAVETQGTLIPDWLHKCDVVTVSPKGPGMGEEFESELFDTFMYEYLPPAHPDLRHKGFSVKCVIFDQRDIEFMVAIMEQWPQTRNVMFASIGNVDPPLPAKRLHDDLITRAEFVEQVADNYRVLAEEIWKDPRCSSVRVLPQLHTLIWGNKAGVQLC